MRSAEEEFANANKPWDGRWFVPVPKPGLRIWPPDQFTAMQLLRDRKGQTNWSARFLQTIIVQEHPLSDIQRFWLRHLCREHERRLAA